MKRIIALLLLTFVGINQSFSQKAIGEWTDYQSYASAKSVVDSDDKIYCVTEGGLFSYDKKDNSIEKMTSISGLSDVGVQKVAYSKDNGLLFIAYENSNIDLVVGNTVYNLSDIKRKQIQASKTINNILFSGKLAYLSCGFGIVVVNLEKKEIKDTYFIGDGGDFLNVMDLATDGQYFYAATETGIYKASVNEPNLQNYNNWVRQTNLPNSDKKFNAVEYFNGHIIVNYTPNQWDKDELYQFDGASWNRILSNIQFVRDITVNGGYIVFASQESITVCDKNLNVVQFVPKYPLAGHESEIVYAMSAIIDSNNYLWIAYQKHGLVKLGTQAERIIPAGPIDNNIFSLTTNGQDLWIASGGRNSSWNNVWMSPQFQLQREGKWTVFDNTVFTNSNKFTDIVCIAVDPNSPDHVFAGSWGGGVLEFTDGKFVKRYDNYNSSLQTQLATSPADPYVRIGGMAFDSKGVLWVSNTGVANVLSSMQTDGTWKSYEVTGSANKFTGKVVVTKNDDKWLVLPMGNGLCALNSTNSVSKAQKVVAHFENGTDDIYTDMNDIYSIAEDNDGALWIGTSMGVAVFSSPEKIWKDATMYASRPDGNSKNNFFDPLLKTESVTAIAVDGANRKWIGTKTSGIYLVSADGGEELQHFTTDNSPLLNNEITDIALNQKTGEVFIGTVSGLISYMGEATAGNDVFTDVYVYPNPVRETYNGPVVVKGLVDDTDVRITDITGNLVYKTKSLGGQAVWDGKNQNGNRCKTGVYLVFLTDSKGEQTKITKLMFIH
jgi:ligand-binding sensor domain-containing protein